MNISHGVRMSKWHDNNGYGYATNKMLESLGRLGHDVNQNDPDAPVQIWFDQPHHWKWNNNLQYRIGYHPWESTDMKSDWKTAMNETDEIWTPSPLIANWYEKMGITKPIYVYEHGVDHDVWVPKKRRVSDTFRFLHVGGEAARKGGDIALDAFRVAFEGRKDVEITMKMHQPGWKIRKYGQTNVITEMLSLPDLIQLYHDHHCFVYPSYGEGFGLNPLQAISTGMPVVMTSSWAPYGSLIPNYSRVNSTLTDSPWPDLHPGKMFKPDFDDLVDRMRWIVENYDECADNSMAISEAVKHQYDWDEHTKNAFSALENRLKLNYSNSSL